MANIVKHGVFDYLCAIMKKDYYISKMMQDDLIKAYNKVAPFCWSQKDAYEKTVKQPAPRYYITPKQAAQVLSPMLRGDFERVNMMQNNKRRMYYSLLEKVNELSEKRAFVGKSLRYIAEYAVIQPAPEFFMQPSNLEFIRLAIKNGRCDEEGRYINIPSRERSYEKMREKRKKLLEYRAMMRELKNSTQ